MYKAQKVKKYALNSQLQAVQILTNDDEVESWSLSSFLLAVTEVLFKLYCAVRKSARKCGNQFSSWNAAIHMLSSARFDSENCCKGTL